MKKEIYYGYGLTVHKMQGSTIKNIILDAEDICYVAHDHSRPRVNYADNKGVISLRNRLLYTGLTRVENIAHIIF
jgi:ATP-dependent exoDNAse (exonuclease V) alpha subunit